MLTAGPPIRLLPRLDDLNRFFWTGGADGKLRFQYCPDCDRLVHPPAPCCPTCLGSALEVKEVSGRATVESFTVNHQQWIPGSEPYAIAWVSIIEQPDVRLTTNLVGVDEARLSVGFEVQVVFEQHEDVYLPLFGPRSGDEETGGGS